MNSSPTATKSPPPSTLSRVSRTIGRITAPISRQLAGRRVFPLWGIVHHRGRRSGRAYSVPVAIGATDSAFVIPLPWGESTQWLRNVLAAGECTVRWCGRDHRATHPTVVGIDEADQTFSPMLCKILRAAGIRSFLRLRRIQI